MNDATLEVYIREAEALIDRFIAYPYKGYHGYVGQQLLFPREIDEAKAENTDTYPVDYVGIPQSVTRAALYAVENLVLVGDIEADQSGAGAMLSERFSDYQYTKAEAKGDSALDAGILIGKRARAILQKYRRAYRGMTIGKNFENVELLNSRQRFANDNY